MQDDDKDSRKAQLATKKNFRKAVYKINLKAKDYQVVSSNYSLLLIEGMQNYCPSISQQC